MDKEPEPETGTIWKRRNSVKVVELKEVNEDTVKVLVIDGYDRHPIGETETYDRRLFNRDYIHVTEEYKHGKE